MPRLPHPDVLSATAIHQQACEIAGHIVQAVDLAVRDVTARVLLARPAEAELTVMRVLAATGDDELSLFGWSLPSSNAPVLDCVRVSPAVVGRGALPAVVLLLRPRSVFGAPEEAVGLQLPVAAFVLAPDALRAWVQAALERNITKVLLAEGEVLPPRAIRTPLHSAAPGAG